MKILDKEYILVYIIFYNYKLNNFFYFEIYKIFLIFFFFNILYIFIRINISLIV